MYNSNSNTNSVQSFMRTLAWVLTLLVLLFPMMALSALSSAIFGTGAVLSLPFLIFSLWVCNIVAKMFFVLPEWDAIVLLRLGKFHAVKGAGFFVIPPFIYSVAAIVDMRIETYQVEATATLTKDNVPTKVTAAIEFKVDDPKRAVIDVQNYRSSIIWLSTEALKNTIGSMDLKELLSERDQIAESLKIQLDKDAAIYGIDIRAVRLTDIDTPPSLVEELAVIARARRSSEAKKIEAEAEVLVAEKIAQATRILDQSKNAMKLRELQLLSEMSKEESTMVIIYPYGDQDGKMVAQAAAGNAHNKDKTNMRNIEEVES